MAHKRRGQMTVSSEWATFANGSAMATPPPTNVKVTGLRGVDAAHGQFDLEWTPAQAAGKTYRSYVLSNWCSYRGVGGGKSVRDPVRTSTPVRRTRYWQRVTAKGPERLNSSSLPQSQTTNRTPGARDRCRSRRDFRSPVDDCALAGANRCTRRFQSRIRLAVVSNARLTGLRSRKLSLNSSAT